MDSNNLNDKQKSEEDLKTNINKEKKGVNDENKNISNN